MPITAGEHISQAPFCTLEKPAPIRAVGRFMGVKSEIRTDHMRHRFDFRNVDVLPLTDEFTMKHGAHRRTGGSPARQEIRLLPTRLERRLILRIGYIVKRSLIAHHPSMKTV